MEDLELDSEEFLQLCRELEGAGFPATPIIDLTHLLEESE